MTETRIPDLVREGFDPPFYQQHNPDLTAADDPLHHYVHHGWREGRDPAEWFSVRDYLRDNPDVLAAGIDPFLHYLAHGREEGRKVRVSLTSPHRHRREFFEATKVFLPTIEEGDFDASAFAHAAGLLSTEPWQALARFVENGLFRPQLLAAAAPSAKLLQALGEQLFDVEPVKAMRCLQLAFHQGMSKPQLLHELADFYWNRNMPIEAISHYRAAIRAGLNNYWTHHNLAGALHSLGDYRASVSEFDQAWRLVPERLAVRYRRDEVAGEHFWVRLSRAYSLVVEGDMAAAVSETEAAILDYCALALNAQDAPRKPGPQRADQLRVAIFGPEGIPQCRLYRMQQKVDQLHHAGATAEIFTNAQADEIRDKVSQYHVLVVFRMPATPKVIDVIATARRFGVTTFYDVDDLIFDAERYPPPYDTLSDVVTPFEYAGLVTGLPLHRIALELCDYGITSTPTLVETMARHVRERRCFLSRNALSDVHVAALERIEADPPVHDESRFTIFYGSGTKTHNADMALATPALARFLSERRNARLHVMGPVDLGPLMAPLAAQIVRVPFSTDLHGYWREVAKADVNLAPLVAAPFNDAKSEIKWMEAGMVGVPSIVSSSATYDAVVRHGEDGLIAHNEGDWYPLLCRLADDRPLARRIGAAARRKVLADYGLTEGSRQLVDAFTGVLPARARRTKPRLLVVNLYYPPEYIGGATRIAEQTVNDLTERYGDDYEVSVFSGRFEDGRPGFLDRYQWHGVEVTTLGETKDVDAIERSVATEEIFANYVDDLDPQLVHFHAIQGLSASLIDVVRDRAIPYVVTVHDCWWISDRQFLTDDLGALVSQTGAWGDPRRLGRLRQCLADAHATIAVSDTHAALYRSRGIPNVVVVTNGSDTREDVPWPEDDGQIWLGMLGGYHRVKGIELLKEALHQKRFDKLRFLVVDHRMLEGIERSELWGDNVVTFVGKTSFANVDQIYARLHGVLAISTCFESFGLIAREAQRLGRWVVASNRGGTADDLTDGVDGFVIDPAKTTDLVRVLNLMDADPARFRKPAPRTEVVLRTPQQVTDDCVAIYRQMVPTGGAGDSGLA